MVGEKKARDGVAMKPDDLEKFTEVFIGLCEYFDKKFSQALLEIYWTALKDWPIEQFVESANRAVRELKFFPKISELIELVEGDPSEQAERSWLQLLDAVRCYGGGCSVWFEDGRIVRCIQAMGGWEQVCMWTVNETKYRHAEFVKLYKALPPMPPDRVVGSFEADNARKGYLSHDFIDLQVICPVAVVNADGTHTRAITGDKIKQLISSAVTVSDSGNLQQEIVQEVKRWMQ